jgi:tape measure domain-containing protein
MNMDAILRVTANVQGENNIRRLGNSLQGLEGQAKNAGRSLATLRDGFRGLNGVLAGIGTGLAIGKIFGDTATLESQARSLEVLTGSAKQAGQIIKELQTFANVTPFESTELIDTAKRLNAFGVESSRVVEVTKRLGDVAGATGSNIGELATAYGQVVAKGRLQGEELLQFQERGVALQQELQKMYGLSGQELQKALSSGRISAEAVEVAIKRLTTAGGKYANGAIAQSDTLKGKLSTLQDAFTGLAINIGKALTPIFKWLLDRTTELINRLNGGFAGVNANIKAEAAAGRATAAKFKGFDRIQLFNPAAAKYYEEQKALFLKQAQSGTFKPALPTGSLSVPALLPPNSSADSSNSKSKAKVPEDITQREFELRKAISIAKANENNLDQIRLEKELAIYEAMQLQGTPLKQRLAIGEAEDNFQKQLQDQFKGYGKELVDGIQERINKRNEEIKQYNELRIASGELSKDEERQLRINEKLHDIQKQYPDLWARTKEEIIQLVEASQGLTEVQQRNKDIMQGIADSVGGALKSGFDALINGTKDWAGSLREIAGNLLKSIADQLLQIMVIAPIVKAISSIKFANGGVFEGGAVTPFANGGVVSKPTVFPFANGIGLMGEAGPEAIMPLRRGPNGRLGVEAANGGGGTTINVSVDAKGSSVQGDGNKGDQLGRVVAAAVQQEMIKQKRPGGLLAT